MTAPSPYTHRCLVSTCVYDLATEGTIYCARDHGGCGRRWTFVPGRGWVPDPVPVGTFKRRDR